MSWLTPVALFLVSACSWVWCWRVFGRNLRAELREVERLKEIVETEVVAGGKSPAFKRPGVTLEFERLVYKHRPKLAKQLGIDRERVGMPRRRVPGVRVVVPTQRSVPAPPPRGSVRSQVERAEPMIPPRGPGGVSGQSRPASSGGLRSKAEVDRRWKENQEKIKAQPCLSLDRCQVAQNEKARLERLAYKVMPSRVRDDDSDQYRCESLRKCQRLINNWE